jgi:hypothetical protein
LSPRDRILPLDTRRFHGLRDIRDAREQLTDIERTSQRVQRRRVCDARIRERIQQPLSRGRAR